MDIHPVCLLTKHRLFSICKTVGVSADGDPKNAICADNVDLLYTAYLAGLDDYTIDSRGDAGSW